MNLMSAGEMFLNENEASLFTHDLNCNSEP